MNVYKVVLLNKKFPAKQGESMPPGSSKAGDFMAEDIEELVRKLVDHVLPVHPDMRILSIKETVTDIQ